MRTLLPGEARHTDQATLGKWETGETAVRVEDMTLLAAVYGVTPDRLFFPPGDDKTPALLQRAYEVLTSMAADDVERWMSIGEALARKS